MNIKKNRKYIILFLILIIIFIFLLIDYHSKKINNNKIHFSPIENLETTKKIIKNTTSTPEIKKTLTMLDINNQEQLSNSQKLNFYKKTMTSFFWVGEDAGYENNNIANYDSVWDDFWVEHYGGIDLPTNRCNYQPCSFNPGENPFYFALPYNDLKQNDKRKTNSKNIPWYNNEGNKKSILKNKWIEIKYKNKLCFAQWEDVGPNNENDYDYVFGNSQSTNKFGIKAGLDVSPAVRDYLIMDDNDFTEWRFVDYSEIPDGPWKNIITKRNISR